ncbi:ORF6N domain-containing protein [Chitinophaga sp.]|uniref:ORF6N domain-containing protein n=1 Tax=Chitinophaga sp. TaxID=1869181 RepID=UPI0031D0D447
MTKLMLATDDEIKSKILSIRGKRVMIDKDLAELYSVPTKRLNEQVKRNLIRFPEDFMFQLTADEKEEVVAKCDHLKNIKFSSHLPYVFTEHGVVMLASVLNSDQAIAVNVQIVRMFVQMREALLMHKDVLLRLEQLEKRVTVHDGQIELIFKHLRQLLSYPAEPRVRIGFRREDTV